MLNIKKLLPLAVLPLLGLQANGAFALPAGLDIELTTTTATTSVNDGTRTKNTSSTPSGKVVSSSTESTGTSYGLNSEAKGNLSGWAYGNATASGIANNYSSSLSLVQQYTITNNSSSDLELGFQFLIDSGALNISSQSNDDAVIMSYFNAYIDIDGASNNPQWFTSNTLIQDASDVIFEQSGQSLGDYTDGEKTYGWNAQNYELSLGTLAAGESFILNYNIESLVDYTCLSSATCDDYFAKSTFGSVDNILSDTPNFGFSAIVIPEKTPTSVNEPASIALLGLGLTGLAFARRRKFA